MKPPSFHTLELIYVCCSKSTKSTSLIDDDSHARSLTHSRKHSREGLSANPPIFNPHIWLI